MGGPGVVEVDDWDTLPYLGSRGSWHERQPTTGYEAGSGCASVCGRYNKEMGYFSNKQRPAKQNPAREDAPPDHKEQLNLEAPLEIMVLDCR